MARDVALEQSQLVSVSADPRQPEAEPFLVEPTVLMARQPIFDRNRQVWGYELLYRSGSVNHCDDNEPGGRATARVIVNSLLNIGIDDLVGSKLALINFDREMLLSEFPWMLPPKRVILEILETVTADPEIIAICSKARESGFTLALDDVDERTHGSPLLHLVDIIKVDFRTTSPSAREDMARLYGCGRAKMLAEKVETEEEFQLAMALGYQYFQGYFFARPSIVSGSSLPVTTVSLLQILGQLTDPDLSVKRLEAAVRQHVSLAHKLIRYMNSCAFAWSSPIQSLSHALALLGTDQLRKIVSLMVVADINGEGPQELLVKALLRARMSELLSHRFGLKSRSGSLFLMGLFSMLDVILHHSMEEVLRELNLEDDICNALLGRSPAGCPIGRLYRLVITYEVAEWSTVVTEGRDADVDSTEISRCYLQALRWADEASHV